MPPNSAIVSSTRPVASSALHQVRAIVDDAADRADLVELAADEVDLALLAEAVDDDVGAGFREGAGDAEADAAGRSGDDRDLAGRAGAPRRSCAWTCMSMFEALQSG